MSKKRENEQSEIKEQGIEELQKRYNDLNTRKIQAETNLLNSQKQLETHKSQAREKYGTDDVAELRKQLEEMKAENERKRREYQESLDRIEKDLTQVDEKFADAATSSTEAEGSE
ncbi:hypothetical protein [Thalassoglobus polymorphus]|uniref:Uncharacterized protein n=1 Tax=Thalassoglobus polymorphus TaxID=2527994 RepID=A0A517QJ77_9PLAN|nr:hypothetical protein [Thalassoglobus polymorphus]QDT31676.1 hypothetical protein Mal48_09110 [Thalassoglobus polymorphus]